MITLEKMCDDLAFRLAAAGHWLMVEDNVVITDDDNAVAAIIDAYTAADFSASKQRAVSDFATTLRDRLVAGVSAAEMAGWAIKLAEAKAYDAANGFGVLTPALSAEAEAAKSSLADLVQVVLAKAAVLTSAEAQISGVKTMHKNAIANLTTFEDIAAYDFTGGWPEV